jgi:hypothetical protein
MLEQNPAQAIQAADARVHGFLDIQNAALVRVNPADYMRVEPRDHLVVVTPTIPSLSRVREPSSEGALFRTALFQVMLDAVATRKSLVIDLSNVTHISSHSVFTLDDVSQYMQTKGLRAVYTGVQGEVVSALNLGRTAIGMGGRCISAAATIKEAEQIALAA